MRTFHKHFGPDALSGGKLNEANQRHIDAEARVGVGGGSLKVRDAFHCWLESSF
jgi:hypothetical protein